MASGPLEIPLLLGGQDGEAAARAGRRRALVAALRTAIESGQLEPHRVLPASRVLAKQVRVSRGTVVEAYEQLVGEGYLETTARAATRVAAGVHKSTAPSAPRPVAAVGDGVAQSSQIDLRPGIPAADGVDVPGWRAAWRSAVTDLSAYNPPPAGLPALRDAIAAHLQRYRGLACSPDDVVITSGTDEAVELLVLAEASRRGYAPTIAIEEPGYPAVRRRLRRLGLPTVPLQVYPDRQQWALDDLAEQRFDLVLVSPAHQYPLGAAMLLPARQQLLATAARAGATVIEDDYDSEYRYDHAPRPALAALAPPGLVAHIGSFSKTLTPTLRTAYLVAPVGTELRAALDDVLTDRSPTVSGITQAALARFLTAGDLARHIARTRRRYARRRADALHALADLPAGYRLLGAGGGLHLVLQLPATAPLAAEADLVDRLADTGVLVTALAYYYAHPDLPARPCGIVFGYANPDQHQLQHALQHLRAAIDGHTRGPLPPAADRPAGMSE